MAKVTKKTAFIGLAGIGLLAFSALRKPRYLVDGTVASCEGVDGADCTSVQLARGGGTGELRSPFTGVVAYSQPGVLLLASESEPVLYGVEYAGQPIVAVGQKVSTGELVARAEQAKVKFYRINRNGEYEVISPSAWVAVNGLSLAKEEGGQWCESKKSLSVPRCEKGASGVHENFGSPRMPRWSLRTIQITI